MVHVYIYTAIGLVALVTFMVTSIQWRGDRVNPSEREFMLPTLGILAVGSGTLAVRRLLVLHRLIHGGRLSIVITGAVIVIPAIITLCASMKHHGRR